jgi:hypothetical protein
MKKPLPGTICRSAAVPGKELKKITKYRKDSFHYD